MRWLPLVCLMMMGCPKNGAVRGGPSAARADVAASTDTVEVVVSTEEKINNAVGFLTTGTDEDLLRAISILEEVVADEPNRVMARFNLGVAYFTAFEAKKALKEFKLVTSMDETNEDALLYLGHSQFAAGRSAEALATYRAGVGYFPENMELRVALITGLRRAGMTDAAISEAREALLVRADSLAVYNAMALAYVELDELDLAAFVYEKAEQRIPGADQNAQIQCNYGWLYYLRGERRIAEVRLKRAVELDPTLVPALAYLSEILIDDRNYTDAVPLLEQATRRDPDNAALRINLGIAYRGTGAFGEARSSYERALELQPNDPDPWFNLGILLGDYLKEYSESVSAFNTYLSSGGSQVELAEAYIAAIEKEQKVARKRKQREEDRKRREAEREERQRMVEQAEREAAEAAKAEPAAPPAEMGASTEDPWGTGNASAQPTSPSDAPTAESTESPTSGEAEPAGNTDEGEQ